MHRHNNDKKGFNQKSQTEVPSGFEVQCKDTQPKHLLVEKEEREEQSGSKTQLEVEETNGKISGLQALLLFTFDMTQIANQMAGGRFRELLRKYGKVALGVHFSVSTASITGLYIAIRNNVDVESLFDKWHLPGISTKDSNHSNPPSQQQQEVKSDDGFVTEDREKSTSVEEVKKRNRTAELASSAGGALALAVLCNKALFPIRVPITIALTPPVARFLARRGIIKKGL
ncbi:hypothetical protein GH714_032479 [Hevea brasiliensis]|uniref:DUF1279 domain-containing protein n=1 Tax=Hevea brasiliensis TaxID=3981 RepID=A0A6A6LM38_HEVBR|nr:hypothetical protein GH714_032479 [Hevea brasiliensis]